MEYKDPVFELLSSLEHIVFKDDNQKLTSNRKSTVFSEFEQLRKGTGLKIDDFANVMGVSVAMVREWESRRVRPSPTELKLMRLIQANPQLSITRLISRAAAKASKGAFAAAP
ncbi:transcriptional regulator [Klebsiella pneumoniae]|uniref:HTH-type transcriptional regulator n=3 Tax=Klebsiella TaxID=570 RepID=UPI000E2BD266|nr:HTH-type transcriptional regulator [Klebsiella pneumoniae]SWY21039.1 transcriptional regulator [Klebsiella pneumoniae]SXC28739.1 transcriptional regulator [Klebsiella pneumoniae]